MCQDGGEDVSSGQSTNHTHVTSVMTTRPTGCGGCLWILGGNLLSIRKTKNYRHVMVLHMLTSEMLQIKNWWQDHQVCCQILCSTSAQLRSVTDTHIQTTYTDTHHWGKSAHETTLQFEPNLDNFQLEKYTLFFTLLFGKYCVFTGTQWF